MAMAAEALQEATSALRVYPFLALVNLEYRHSCNSFFVSRVVTVLVRIPIFALVTNKRKAKDKRYTTFKDIRAFHEAGVSKVHGFSFSSSDINFATREVDTQHNIKQLTKGATTKRMDLEYIHASNFMQQGFYF
jgi:hypothetical protein